MIKNNIGARVVDLDGEPYRAAPAPASWDRMIDLDLPARISKRKPKPNEAARDAPPPGNWFGWYRAPKATLPGHVVGFGYSKGKNAAGFYVSFTMIWSDARRRGTTTRSNFHGWKTKRAAIDYCLDRLRDASKPKRERRYVINAPR